MLGALCVYIRIKLITRYVTKLCKQAISVVPKEILQTHVNIFRSKVLTLYYIRRSYRRLTFILNPIDMEW